MRDTRTASAQRAFTGHCSTRCDAAVCYNESTRAAVCALTHYSGSANIMTPPFLHGLSVSKPILALLLAAPLLLAAGGNAAAQNVRAVPSDAPPKMETLPDDDQSGINIRRPDTTKSITDSRDHSGAVTETRVQTGVSTYYVRPNNQAGNAQPGDGQSSSNRAAQFKITEFDLGRRTSAPPVDVTPQVLEPAKN